METLQAIFTRRSIRKYKNKEVPVEILHNVLKAGMYAPSAVNKRPWEFIVINDKETLTRITEFHPYSKMLLEAPIAIAVCGDKERVHDFEYLFQDLSAAIENMLLAAHDQGLGTVWLGIYPREARMNGLKELLDLPDKILPMSVIALGYADETKEMPERFEQNRIHLNSWGETYE